jgi:capsular exopolysaccharide synthesis family protein
MMTLAAPLLSLLATLGLFLLIEVRSGRVADPDDIAARVRIGVIGIVPPLPSPQPARSPRALRDQRRKLEEFVQSLDHLRVTLCSRGPGGHRCALITSAVGGEGKTTLAAQLAGRCANAGLSTLLIDADLRRPSLGELLEVPEGRGLVDVLLGDATPEEAMVVIGNAGGFHLLPAGSTGHDPSRLLQGERLGQLIARFREAFDIVIIDAPPVLAVPDALLLGRWADGAVVAVRHDASRFPLVERAIKRMSAVGVPMLGVVVNGVRPAEASYENYHYHSSHYADVGATAHGALGTDDELPG